MARRTRAPKAQAPEKPEDDITNENCYIIPFDANGAQSRQGDTAVAFPNHPSAQWDIEDGPATRLSACATALTRCLDRMHTVLAELRAATVNEMYDFVAREADVNPLMPYTTTPTVIISASDPGLVKDIMGDLCERLEQSASNKVVHLHPNECLNISNTLKMLVSSFVGDGVQGSSRGTSSNDLAVLRSWFQIQNPNGPARVVVLFHNIEMFDVQVLQELFNINSLYASDIPFVYCLGTAARPDFLRTCLPRATLACLEIRKFAMSQTSTAVFETLIRKLFLDPDFSPDVMLGPAAFDLLLDEANRFNASVDSLQAALRLVHMHHFMEPLTSFCLDELLGESDRKHAARLLDNTESTGFKERLQASLDIEPGQGDTGAKLLDLVSNARHVFVEKLRSLRVAFGLLNVVQIQLRHQQFRVPELRYGFGHLVQLCFAGTLEKMVKELCELIPQLSTEQLRAFLAQVDMFFYSLSPKNCSAEQEIRTRIIQEMDRVDEIQSHEEIQLVASGISRWIQGYLADRLVKLDDLPMYNAFCTGHTTFSAELLNANPRASVLASLIYPHRITHPGEKSAEHEDSSSDTSILFKLYLESGKLINIHDWYQAFDIGLTRRYSPTPEEEAEKECGLPNTPKRRKRGRPSKSPQKSPAKSRKMVKQKEAEPDDREAETKSRFLRSYHELEYLGFIRQTRRKVEHVQRTVFETRLDDGPNA